MNQKLIKQGGGEKAIIHTHQSTYLKGRDGDVTTCRLIAMVLVQSWCSLEAKTAKSSNSMAEGFNSGSNQGAARIQLSFFL